MIDTNPEELKLRAATFQVQHNENGESQNGEKAESGQNPFAPKIDENSRTEQKSTWWPNCTHARYTRLATRKFRDRIVILWKCRKCPKRTTEVIDIDLNSRNVFTKSTITAIERKYEPRIKPA